MNEQSHYLSTSGFKEPIVLNDFSICYGRRFSCSRPHWILKINFIQAKLLPKNIFKR